MEDDEARVLFRQPEFQDDEYDASSHSHSNMHDYDPAAPVANSGNDSGSFSLAAIENVIVHTVERLTLRRTEGAYKVVERSGGAYSLQWRQCEAEMLRCVGIALALYVVVRFWGVVVDMLVAWPLTEAFCGCCAFLGVA